MKRKRIAEGVYEDRYGREARVHVFGVQVAKRFPRKADLRAVQRWRDRTAQEIRDAAPTATRGTLAADVLAYLKTLADRPRLRRLRTVHLAWWVARFGHRPRYTLKAPELRAALAELASTPLLTTNPPRLPTAKTVAHYRTALFSLYTVLDGKDAPNPLRDVAPPRSPDPEPRAIPFPIVEAILEALPERGQGLRHQPRAIASKTRARLAVMAHVGLPPAQMMQIRPEHVNWHEPSVLVAGRKKGKGTKTVRLPLTPDGAAALRRFFDVHAAGRFSTSSVRQSFRRAIQTLVDELARDDYRAAGELWRRLQGARPYDLRHSFLTDSYLAGKDLHGTQLLAMHADSRMTERYTLAAVDPRLQQLAREVAQHRRGRGRSAGLQSCRIRATPATRHGGAEAPHYAPNGAPNGGGAKEGANSGNKARKLERAAPAGSGRKPRASTKTGRK